MTLGPEFFAVTGELLIKDPSTGRAQGKDFGIVFSLLCAIFLALREYRGHPTSSGWSLFFLGATVALLLLALFAPTTLATPAKQWLKVGHAIGAVMSKVIVTLTFLIIMLPMALLLKLLGKDLLKLKRPRNVTTYWEPISSKDRTPDTYLNPF